MSVFNIQSELQKYADSNADAIDLGAANTLKVSTLAERTLDAGVSLTGVLTTTGGLVTSAVAATSNIRTSGGDIGYATGAGGTVTQGTSKSTGVTLPKVCGEIVMNNESLAGGAEASFVVTNTLVAATDVVVVCCKTLGSGGTGTYIPAVTLVADGSFTITVANVGTTASEAVVLSFAVIHAVKA